MDAAPTTPVSVSPTSETGTLPSRPRKIYTLVIPIEQEKKRIILGYKKRGFGVGKYNGYGGKVEPGETILEGAIRELEEESTLIAKEINHIAILFLEATTDHTAPILEIHVYALMKWEGTPQETEEMRPEYFTYDTPSPVPSERSEVLQSHTRILAGPHGIPPPPHVSSSASIPPSSTALKPIPYDTMWEETRLWMEEFLNTLSTQTSPKSHTHNDTAPLCDQTSPPHQKFIHYVTFHGGTSPQTNIWSIWEGLEASDVTHFNPTTSSTTGLFQSDISLWTSLERDTWLTIKRNSLYHPNGKLITSSPHPRSEYHHTQLTAFLANEWSAKFSTWKTQSQKFIRERDAWKVEKASWHAEIAACNEEKKEYLLERATYEQESRDWKDEEKKWNEEMGKSREEKERHAPGYRTWLGYRQAWVSKWGRWSEMRGRWISGWEKRSERRLRRIEEYERWVRECERWTREADEWIAEVRVWLDADEYRAPNSREKDE